MSVAPVVVPLVWMVGTTLSKACVSLDTSIRYRLTIPRFSGDYTCGKAGRMLAPFMLRLIKMQHSFGFAKPWLNVQPEGAGWVQLAEAAALLAGINAEVRHALHRAEHFGPWERYVQRKTAWIGIASWKHLSEEDRELIRRTVHRALLIDNDVEGLERLSARYGWQNELFNIIQAAEGRSSD